MSNKQGWAQLAEEAERMGKPKPKAMEEPKKLEKPTTIEEVHALMALANTGDPEARALLRTTLDERPNLSAVAGNMGLIAEHAVAEAISRGSHIMHESLVRQAAVLRRALKSDAIAAIEDIAIQRLSTCTMQMYFAETVMARSGERIRERLGANKELDSAYRRFDQTAKLLLLIHQVRAITPIAAMRVEAVVASSAAAAEEAPNEVGTTPDQPPVDKAASTAKGRKRTAREPKAKPINGHATNGHAKAAGNGRANATNGHAAKTAPLAQPAENGHVAKRRKINGHAVTNRVALFLPVTEPS